MSYSLLMNALSGAALIFCAHVANAEVFMTDSTECFQIKKVEKKTVYYVDDSSTDGSQLKKLDASLQGLRYGEILAKAMKAASEEKSLCGSIRGIAVLSKAEAEAKLAGEEKRRKEEQCRKEREDYKASLGIVGILNSKQMGEIDGVYAKCMGTTNADKGSAAPSRNSSSSGKPVAR